MGTATLVHASNSFWECSAESAYRSTLVENAGAGNERAFRCHDSQIDHYLAMTPARRSHSSSQNFIIR